MEARACVHCALQGRTRVRLGIISFVAQGRWSGGFRAVMRIPRYLFKLIAVFAASVPAIVIGGAAYRATSGKTMLDGIANVYGAIYKIPGDTSGLNSKNLQCCHLEL